MGNKRYITAKEANRMSKINIGKRKEREIEEQKKYVMKRIGCSIDDGDFSYLFLEDFLYPEVIDMLHELGYKVTQEELKPYYTISWED